MYLKSVSGSILFEGRFATVKRGLEMAIEDNCVLDGIDLRKANLAGAFLDGGRMHKACLWGANLNSADLSHSSLYGADFRTANLLNTCLAESNCNRVDFSGSYFSRTILRDTNLSNARFSCPSIFTVDLSKVNSLEGAIYSHLGEVDCDFSDAPLIIQGLDQSMVFMRDSVLVGNKICKANMRESLMASLKRQIDSSSLIKK